MLADSGDAIVFDDNVCVGDDVVAVHSDDSRPAQNDRAAGTVAGKLQFDRDLFRLGLLGLSFLRAGGRRGRRSLRNLSCSSCLCLISRGAVRAAAEAQAWVWVRAWRRCLLSSLCLSRLPASAFRT